MRPSDYDANRIRDLYVMLQLALYESFRVRETAEALSEAVTQFASELPPERRKEPRTGRETLASDRLTLR
jgi:hypothetical protein